MGTDRMERKFTPLGIADVEADGMISGYASLFGEVDLGRDRVEQGAFRKSIKARGIGGIRMLFQHDPAMPIGHWQEIREDERGLFVRGQLAKSATRAGEVLALIRDGALDGLSIGFRTVRSKTDAASGVRRILEADLWEISVVTFPMLPGARVEAVKAASRLVMPPTKRDIERRLTRDAGLTRGQARALIAKGYSGLTCEREAAHITLPRLARKIRQAATQFK